MARGTSWLKAYLQPFSIASPSPPATVPEPTFVASIAPVSLLVLVVIGCVYWSISNEWFMQETLARAEADAVTTEEIQRLENTRTGIESALRNPGIRLLLSARSAIVLLRSYLLFIVVLWLTLSFMSGRWGLFLPLWLASGASTSILVCGIMTNTVLKVVLLKQVAALGPILFIESGDLEEPVTVLLTQVDAFLLWYMAHLSGRLSSQFDERPLYVFLASYSIWLALILTLRVLSGMGVSLTLN